MRRRLPSRRARWVGPLVLLVLLAGCSGGLGSSSSGQEPPHVRDLHGDASEDVEEETALTGALLTEQDLPYGFTATEDDVLETESALCEAGGQTLDISAVDDAGSAFASQAEDLIVMHAIERHEPGAAERELEAVRQESAACNGQPADSGSPLSVEPVMFPTFGDDTAAFRITQTDGSVEIVLDLVAFRTGDLLSYVAAAGPCACPPDLLIELAGVAEARAEELAGVPT